MPGSVRSRLIESAVELIRRNGVPGTAVSGLIDHSGVSRRSIYINFPGGKKELIDTSVTAAGGAMGEYIRNLTEGRSPVEALGDFIDFWKRILIESDFTAGCPIAAGAYGGQDVPDARDSAGTVFHEWEIILISSLVDNGVSEDSAPALATTVISAIEGAVMLCLAAQELAPLERVQQQMEMLIEANTSAP